MKMLHCPRCQQQAHRLKRSSHKMDGEEAVVISLAISLGMIVMTIVGWWLWKIFGSWHGTVG